MDDSGVFSYYYLYQMNKVQFVSLYSDRDEKKVIKIMHETYFYARKFFKLKKDHSKYASELIQARIASKFSTLKEQFQSNVSTTPENVLVATCPFYDHQSLLEFIQANPSKVKNISELLESFMILMLRGDNEYFYTYENIFVNPFTFEIAFAPFSIAGLIPLRFKTSFSKQQFAQVYELLDEQMFTRKNVNTTYKAKFRAIGMIILHIILQRRISLLLDNDISSEQVSFQDARKLVGLLQERFLTLLTIPYARELITKAGERDKIDYLYFLKVVFIDNCKDLTWQQVRRCLIRICKSQPSDIHEPMEIIVKNLYAAQKLYAKEKLQELGIYQSQLNIYLVYKLQISKLDFDKMSDLITRQKYVSSENSQLFIGIVKQIQKLKEALIKCDANGKEIALQTIDLINEQNSKIAENQSNTIQNKSNIDTSKSMSYQKKKQIDDWATQGIPKSRLPTPGQFFLLSKSQKSVFINQYIDSSQCSKRQIEYEITQKFNIEANEKKQYDNQHPGFVYKDMEENEERLIKEMANHFKTNVSEFRGTKIHALDYKMGIINRYLRL